MTYNLSARAAEDIEAIWLHTYKYWSSEQADRYVQVIVEELKFLCSHPFSGKDISDVREGYRSSKVKSHLIFYKVNNGVIEIIRVLHQRMDTERRIEE